MRIIKPSRKPKIEYKLLDCKKASDGRHNFPVQGCDCINGCGTNQFILSGMKIKNAFEGVSMINQ